MRAHVHLYQDKTAAYAVDKAVLCLLIVYSRAHDRPFRHFILQMAYTAELYATMMCTTIKFRIKMAYANTHITALVVLDSNYMVPDWQHTHTTKDQINIQLRTNLLHRTWSLVSTSDTLLMVSSVLPSLLKFFSFSFLTMKISKAPSICCQPNIQSKTSDFLHRSSAGKYNNSRMVK